jgi:hypothetical protein
MRFNSLSHAGPRAPTIWVQVTLSRRLDPDAVAAWKLRLRKYLRNRHLLGAIAPSRRGASSDGPVTTPFERGVLISWLVAQPEVVFVRVERRPALADVMPEVTHG